VPSGWMNVILAMDGAGFLELRGCYRQPGMWRPGPVSTRPVAAAEC
jgi:hypothetical protein